MTDAPTPKDKRPPAVLRALWLLALATAALVVAIVIGIAAGVSWIWRTEAGTAWLLGHVPGLQMTGLKGALGTGTLQADQLKLALPDGAVLELQSPQLQGLAFSGPPHPGAWVGVRIANAEVQRIVWRPPAHSTPTRAPASLRLPLQLQVDALRIDALQIADQWPITGIGGSVELGMDNGTRHRIAGLHAERDRIRLEHAQLRIDTDAPMALSLQAQLQARDASHPWTARLDAAGPLAAPQVRAQLQASRPPGATAQGNVPSLQLQALLKPFEAWPLGDVQLRTQALDLAQLASGWPRTRIDGDATLRSAAAHSPLTADIQLRNHAPGRWDNGDLPLRELDLSLRGQLDAPDRIALQTMVLQLGDARSDGGRLRGSGQWQGHALQLQLDLEQLRPAALDARAPVMQLSGPLQLALGGLPSPNGRAAAAPPQAEVQGLLRGQLEDAGLPPAEIKLDALLRPDALELRELVAHAGSAQAQLAGRLDLLRGHAAGCSGRDCPIAALRWDARGELRDFDPVLWWPGAAGSAWRRGPHRLNAVFSSAASAPLAALRAPLEGWPRIAGRLQLQLGASVLAGVPLQGEATLGEAGAPARAAAASSPALQAEFARRGPGVLYADLSAAQNRIHLHASAAPGTAGSSARWLATVDAPALAGWAPLFALHPAGAAWAPKSGSLHAELSTEGSGATRRIAATAQAIALQAGTLRLTRGELRVDSALTNPDAPLTLSAQVQGLRYGQAAVERLAADLSGTLREHRLRFSADSTLRPPAWVEGMTGMRLGTGSRIEVAASGRWQSTGANLHRNLPWAPGRWQARIEQLQGLPRLASASATAPQAWLSATELALAVEFDAEGRLRAAHADPGRITLFGTALRWTEADWQPGPGGKPRIALSADVEPFAVAPLLGRLQPELGWRGDLQLAGEVRVHAGEQVDIDAVFERRGGDLSVTDDISDPASLQRPLGLSDLRIGLAAHEGTWHFTQAFAGQQIGEMAGAITLQTGGDALWPGPEAPMDGVAQLRVAQLGAWGGWVPPGWRLGGELTVSASFGGRYGAPEVTGRLAGRELSVRNVLQGVQMDHGVVDIGLRGLNAQIENFEFKGGAGSLKVEGGAQLGDTPRAQLKLIADHFQLLGRVDRRIVASGQANLSLAPGNLAMDGNVKVDEGLFDFSRGNAPSLPEDVQVLQPAAVRAAAVIEEKKEAPPPRSTRVALLVELGDKLRIRGRGLDTQLGGALTLSTPGGRLSAQGSVRAEQGTYAAYGQKLEIRRGHITFVGPLEDPRLDILAVRPNIDVIVGVAVTGTALNPRIRLASEPEMSDNDKLSWLVLGRAPSGLGQTDTALLQRAALALLAGEGEAPTDAFLRQIGLTDFSMYQSTEGEVKQTVVSLGRQISQNWYLGYERGVNAAAGSFQLVYRIAQRFTVRAQAGDDSAIDLIWSWRWQ